MVGHAATALLVGDSDHDRTNARLIRKCVVMRTTRSQLRRVAGRSWMPKKNKTCPRGVKCFLLDIPFYRTRPIHVIPLPKGGGGGRDRSPASGNLPKSEAWAVAFAPGLKGRRQRPMSARSCAAQTGQSSGPRADIVPGRVEPDGHRILVASTLRIAGVVVSCLLSKTSRFALQRA
jgi:hypothetical protein